MPPRNRKRSGVKRSRGLNTGDSANEVSNFDASRFSSDENQVWYVLRANNTVLAEVDLDPNFDGLYRFREKFATMGYDYMLDLPRVYYPTLVRQFYANISNKEIASSVGLETYVKSVHIILTRKSLSEILGAKDESPDFEHGKYIVQGDPTWQFEFTLPKYSSSWNSFKVIRDPVTGYSRIESAPIPTKSLRLRHSLLVYLFNHNILPASSSKNDVRVIDVYLLDKIEVGLGKISGILLATIILGAMSRTAAFKGAKKALPYARTLTHIFQHFGMDLTGESYNTASTIVNQATINRIAYRQQHELGDEDEEDEEEHVQTGDAAGTSQETTRPIVHELLQTVISEVRGMREVVDRLDERVNAIEGRLTTIEDNLAAWTRGQNTSN